MKQWLFLPGVLICTLFTAGCGPRGSMQHAYNQAGAAAWNAVNVTQWPGRGAVPARTAPGYAGSMPEGVTAPLPRAIAGPPQNLDLPHKRELVQVMGEYRGRGIHVAAHVRMRGSRVTVYYLPAGNLVHRGTHYDLASARDVQFIGTYPTDARGHWRASWNMRDYPRPGHQPLFFIAVSDGGSVVLIRTDTIS
ncbi:MAG: hypothetical protein K6T78_00535 [Alicyclobacillus sp.]|nr:hypothetical protein [Alicyclobacillus sp.]